VLFAPGAAYGQIMEIVDDRSAAHVVRSWWLVALRGVAAIAFGVLAVAFPEPSLTALLWMFSAYALVYGTLTVGTVLFRRRDEPHWVPALVGGALSVVAGIVGLVVPVFTAVTLLLLIAAYLLVIGVTEMVDAARLRSKIENEWLLSLSGALSVVVGLLLAMFPGPGALGAVLWIGAWAVGVGVLTLALGIRLRSWGREHHLLGPGAT
jgi:uncharacterized membrane protein HdeD (DUF308 family)